MFQRFAKGGKLETTFNRVMKGNEMRKILVIALVLVLMLGTTAVALADTRSTPRSDMVSVSVTNLATGTTAFETLRAGTWYLYTHCEYGSTNNLYPMSAGVDELYFNHTVLSSGASASGVPTSTVSATYENGKPVKQTISYSRDVYTNHAKYASKASASTPYTAYNYGSTSAGTHAWKLTYTVVWNKK